MEVPVSESGKMPPTSKTYVAPQLVSYGHVEKLTQGASLGVVEGGGTMKPAGT